MHPHEFSSDPLPMQAPSFSQGPNSSQRKCPLGDFKCIPMSSDQTRLQRIIQTPSQRKQTLIYSIHIPMSSDTPVRCSRLSKALACQ